MRITWYLYTNIIPSVLAGVCERSNIQMNVWYKSCGINPTPRKFQIIYKTSLNIEVNLLTRGIHVGEYNSEKWNEKASGRNERKKENCFSRMTHKLLIFQVNNTPENFLRRKCIETCHFINFDPEHFFLYVLSFTKKFRI